MKSLTSLAIPCDDNEYLDYIYAQCRSLHTLKLYCYHKDDIIVEDFERMIESAKSGMIKRDFPLTLVLDRLNIKTVVKVMKRLEEEREVAKQIKFQFTWDEGNTDDYKEVLPLIQKEQNPILHSLISTRSQ
jgi:hypothetical protein